MYDKTHLSILARLYYLRCIGAKHTSKENALRGLRNAEKGGSNHYNDLKHRGLICAHPTAYGEQVSLNVNHIRDIQSLLDPSSTCLDKPPLEDSLNRNYELKPFHTTFGEKMVKGIRGKYTYHKFIDDSSKIMANVIVNGKKTTSIDLGSLSDRESLLSKAVQRMDSRFQGRPFKKAQMSQLGSEIEGNRQQPKAIIDMLLFYGYVIRKGKSHYQRTSKQLPNTDLDSYQQQIDKVRKAGNQPQT